MKTENAVIKRDVMDEQLIKATKRAISNRIYESVETNLPPQLIREQQLADLYQVSKKTVMSWRRSGALPFVKIQGAVFFYVSDVTAFVERHRVRAKDH